MRRVVATLSLVTCLVANGAGAIADEGNPDISGGASQYHFLIQGRTLTQASKGVGHHGISQRGNLSSPGHHTRLRLQPICIDFGSATTCGQRSRCQQRRTLVAAFWGARPGDDCAAAPTAQPAALAAAAPPEVTPGLVLEALRRIGLPVGRALTQPRDKTLVNFDTIFYTHPTTVTRDLNLLGQPVEVRATPTSYVWHFGDGSTDRTDSPGRRYPHQDLVHRYRHAHVSVQPSVDVVYTARFRVGGRPWQTIPDAVTIPGPTDALRIAEATPLLSGTGSDTAYSRP